MTPIDYHNPNDAWRVNPRRRIARHVETLNNMDMKKAFYFMMLLLYVLGTINGIGYSIYIGEYVTTIGVAVLAFMAWPTAVNYFKYLTA